MNQLATEQLHASLEVLEEALFQMGAVRDDAGRILDFEYKYCNRAALSLLGRHREDVVGRRLLELFPSHATNGLFDAYVRVTETSEPLRYEFAFDENGVSGEFEVVVSRADDGYVLVGHDISERKRQERELVDLKGQLETALTTRVLVEQAKGYVAALSGTDPSTAFEVLRRYARNHNIKLHDVCRAVLAGNLPRLTK